MTYSLSCNLNSSSISLPNLMRIVHFISHMTYELYLQNYKRLTHLNRSISYLDVHSNVSRAHYCYGLVFNCTLQKRWEINDIQRCIRENILYIIHKFPDHTNAKKVRCRQGGGK